MEYVLIEYGNKQLVARRKAGSENLIVVAEAKHKAEAETMITQLGKAVKNA